MAQTPYGKYLQTERIKARLSLRRVAEALGVSHVYLSEVERGVRAPLKRDRWPALIDAIPSVTMAGLEAAAALSRPVQLSLAEAPPEYQNLALALARRMEGRDIAPADMDKLMKILLGGGSHE